MPATRASRPSSPRYRLSTCCPAGSMLITTSAPSQHCKAFAGGTHVTVQYLLFALILGHAAAAIWHHRVQKDDVLRAMLPQRGA
ncbi:cytochrome b/b6 domain-containing protein [Pseudomonas aeruginosa]|nr:cytochrome b/b6 domain-containing protein [Pseudomonas aeruginosa]MDY1458133.1 cytochrome b/b6 domain-containing protein [Pseudomonas aeruginosa]